MAEMNGTWKLAFWVMTLMCCTWLMGLTWGVVENDRLRVEGDMNNANARIKALERIVDKFDVIKDAVYSIDSRLARIEAKIQ